MITWTEKLIPIKDLKDFEKNPRRISKEEFDNLVKSFEEDGYHSRIKVNHENMTIGGHQRKKAMLKVGFKKDDLIPVLVPDKELSQEEFERINIRDNKQYGQFDFEILANQYDQQKLIEWGMSEEWLLGEFGDDEPEEKVAKEVQPKTVKCPECGCEF